MRSLLLLSLLLLVHYSASGQDVAEEDLTTYLSTAGKYLHGYATAHRIAEAAVAQQAGDEGVPPLFAGGPYDDGWAFSFGKLFPDAFVIRYGVIVSGSGEVLRLDQFDYRREASPYHYLAARGLARIRNDYIPNKAERGFDAAAYTEAVLPFPKGQLTAYVWPKQTNPCATLAGSDVGYRLSRRDLQILERTRYHLRVMAIPCELPQGGAIATLEVPDAALPTPIDVMHAMDRGAPLIVVVERGVYRIEADGAVGKLPESDPLVRAIREHSQE